MVMAIVLNDSANFSDPYSNIEKGHRGLCGAKTLTRSVYIYKSCSTCQISLEIKLFKKQIFQTEE